MAFPKSVAILKILSSLQFMVVACFYDEILFFLSQSPSLTYIKSLFKLNTHISTSPYQALDKL